MSTTVPAAAGEVRDELQVVRSGPPRRSDRTRHERRLGLLLAGPALVLMVAVTGYPILNAVWLSLFDYRLTAPDAREFVWFSNYAMILSDGLFWRQFGVTAAITVVTVAV